MPVLNFNQNGQVVIPLPMPIENGGTGAEDAATARSNLGINLSNFLDTSSNQSVGGNKTFTGVININNSTPSTSRTTGGLVVDGGMGVNGGICTDNVTLKTRLITGTTAAQQGTIVSVPHTLTDPSKVVALNGIVYYDTFGGVPPLFLFSPGYSFALALTALTVDVVNLNTAPFTSSNILSKPFRIIITYSV